MGNQRTAPQLRIDAPLENLPSVAFPDSVTRTLDDRTSVQGTLSRVHESSHWEGAEKDAGSWEGG